MSMNSVTQVRAIFSNRSLLSSSGESQEYWHSPTNNNLRDVMKRSFLSSFGASDALGRKAERRENQQLADRARTRHLLYSIPPHILSLKT